MPVQVITKSLYATFRRVLHPMLILSQWLDKPGKMDTVHTIATALISWVTAPLHHLKHLLRQQPVPLFQPRLWPPQAHQQRLPKITHLLRPGPWHLRTRQYQTLRLPPQLGLNPHYHPAPVSCKPLNKQLYTEQKVK